MTRRVSPYEMLNVEDALNTVLENTWICDTIEVNTEDSLGFILSEDIKANDPIPPFRASIMDGYAVISEDGKGEYPVIGTVNIGNISNISLTKGTIVKISTGAPVPEGADAVVKVEDTVLLDQKDENGRDIVRIEVNSTPGKFIRQIGSDVSVGEVILSANTKIGSYEIGILAASGIKTVKVYGKPKVSVLSTGDELVSFTEKPTIGKIRDSNRPMLLSLLKEHDVETFDEGIAVDDFELMEKKFHEALSHSDIIITSGGVSMGERDFIKPLLEKYGKIHFGRVNMKPGKPTTFATLNYKNSKKLVFALPGNPVSSVVTFTLFVIPCLKKMKGYPNPFHPKILVKTQSTLSLDPERPEYHRTIVTFDMNQNCLVASSTGNQISSRLLSMRSSNALLVLPKGTGTIKEGEFVNGLLIGKLEQ